MDDKENRDPEFQPPKKRLKLSKHCFADPKKSSEIANLTKGYIPPNTVKNTSWALKVFLEWLCAQSESVSNQKCPEDLFEKPETASLNYWIPRFVAEARKQDGKLYPAKTIYQLLAGLQRHMNPLAPKFLDQGNPRFRDIHHACDSTHRELHQQGGYDMQLLLIVKMKTNLNFNTIDLCYSKYIS